MPRMASEQPAGPRRVRPRPETPAAGCFFCCPDLLERRPVVGRPLRSEQPGAVGGLEAVVHLQPAPERCAAVRPAPLVAVDAEERREVRRVLRLPARGCGSALPAYERRPGVSDAEL